MTNFDPERRDLLKVGVVTSGALVVGELWPSAPGDAAQGAITERHRGSISSPQAGRLRAR